MAKQAHRFRAVGFAFGTLCFGLLLSLFASRFKSINNEAEAQQRFQSEAENYKLKLLTQMRSYEHGLRGARGAVLVAGEHISVEAFRRYAASRNIDDEFPGARGFGFIRRVPEDFSALPLEAPQTSGSTSFAVPEFTAHGGERWVVELIEPLIRNSEFSGLNIASQAARREAAQRAMSTGVAAMTSPIDSKQQAGKEHARVLIFLPVYQHGAPVGEPSEREAALIGWTFAPLELDQVVASTNFASRRLLLSISDTTGGEDHIVASDSQGPKHPTIGWGSTTPVFGRNWTFSFQARSDYADSLALTSPLLVFSVGALISALLCGLSLVALWNREQRRLVHAERERLSLHVQNSSDAIIIESSDGVILSWNTAAERLWGVSAESAVGTALREVVGILPRPDFAARAAQPTLPLEGICHKPDGSTIEVSVMVTPLSFGKQSALGLTVQNIGSRKELERAMIHFNDALEAQVHQRTKDLETARRDMRNVVDALPSLIGYWDKGLVNCFANRAYENWFQQEPGSLLGRHRNTLLSEAFETRNGRYVEKVLEGEPQIFETQTRSPDGHSKDLHVHYLPDQVDGEVKGFYVLVHDVTEHRQNERELSAALRENEGLTGTIRKYAMLSTTDAAGKITDVNAAFCERSGYTFEELQGQDHRILNSGFHPPKFWASVWAVLQSGEAWHGEVCDRAKDGTLFWVDAIIAPFLKPDGQIEKYVSIRTDITQLKAMTKALSDGKERLDQIISATQIGTWEYNVQTNQVHFNSQVAAFLGLEGKLSTTDFTMRCDPDDLNEARKSLMNHIHGKTDDLDAEIRVRHVDGKLRWILAKGRLGPASADGPWVYGTLQDVTVEKEERRRLAESEAVLARVGRIAGVGGWQLDVALDRISWTKEALSLFDAPVGAAHTLESMIALISPESRAPFEDALKNAIEGGRSWDFEMNWVTLGGKSRWLRTLGEVERSEKGTQRITGAFQDVTAQRETEQALREATQIARNASAAKSQFLANMSHEIRTPLNAVIGMSYLLSQSVLDVVRWTQSAGQLFRVLVERAEARG